MSASSPAESDRNRSTLFARLVVRESVLNHIAHDPELLRRVMSKVAPRDLVDSVPRQSLIDALPAILDSIEIEELVALIGVDEIIKCIEIQDLLRSVKLKRLVEAAGPDAVLDQISLSEIVKHVGVDDLVNSIKLKSVVKAVGARALVEQVGLAEIATHVDIKELLAEIKLKTLIEAAGAKQVLEHIRVSEIVAHVGADALLKAIAPADIVKFFGPRRLLQEIPLDQLVRSLSAEKILEHFKLKTLVDVAGVDKVLDNIRLPDIVDTIGVDELLRAIPFSQIIETLGTKRMLDSVPASVIIERIGTKELLKNVSVKKLVDAAGAKEIVGHLSVDDRIEGLDMSDRRVLDRLLADPNALSRVLEDDRAVRASLSSEAFRKRSRGLNAYSMAGRLSYPLPVPVVSYPRAGSNFMQMVLQASSGLRCQSLYVALDDPADVTLTVKSHGPSPEYLADEWRQHFPGLVSPTKAIVLRRDPRDQMISFLEYTKSRRECEIDPAHFLDDVDYFYASTIDRDFRRRLYLAGLTVGEAFRRFVADWTQDEVPGVEVLHVRYEDLLADPKGAFARIFEFLALECDLAEDVLTRKISQYGDSGGRERGIVRGWEKHYEQYAPLIEQVQEKLGQELAQLGYGVK